MALEISGIRREYEHGGLDREDLHPDPLRQFEKWYDDRMKAGALDLTAMTLATVTREGRPAARVVLLKSFGPDGFTFFTNYDSRKGRELADTPWATLIFWWEGQERQIRVDGRVEKVNPDESEGYFRSRPRGSRLGAWASTQSEPIESREWLQERMAAMEEQFPDEEVPRPPNWGGYRVVPDAYEFWQGRPSRLHDRFLYERLPAGGWAISRLSP